MSYSITSTSTSCTSTNIKRTRYSAPPNDTSTYYIDVRCAYETTTRKLCAHFVTKIGTFGMRNYRDQMYSRQTAINQHPHGTTPRTKLSQIAIMAIKILHEHAADQKRNARMNHSRRHTQSTSYIENRNNVPDLNTPTPLSFHANVRMNSHSIGFC